MAIILQVGNRIKKILAEVPMVSRQWSKELETDQERRGLFLRILNRGWLIMGFVAVISYFYYPAERPSLGFFIFFSFSTYVVVHLINRSHKTWLAGFIFTSLVNTSFFGAFLLNGFQDGFQRAIDQYQYILMMMALAIIFAGAFIHRWAAFSLAALNSTLLIFVTRAFAPETGPVLSVHIFWWLVATSIWLYETSLFAAFSKLQQFRENLENLVRLRTQKLQETVESLQQTRASLKSKNEELEAFSYSVSHDLRAPLRAIDGYANALREDYAHALNSEGSYLLSRMQENIHKMDQMIQSMLFLSRLDRHPLQWQSINLNRMVQEVIDEVRSAKPNQAPTFQVQDLPPCLGDASLLRQALTRLIDNAVKFSQPRHPAYITIASETDQDGVIYRVEDNGVGFDMSQAHRLFAPFQRLHRLEEFDGNGVGLAIVKRIIQRHNGQVWAKAETNRGAVFYFHLGQPGEDDEVISDDS